MAMGSKSKEAAEKNQQVLMLDLNNFLEKSAELKPKVSDSATFDSLVKAVQESTQKNENNAQFLGRLSAAGEAVKTLASTLGLIA